MKLNLLEIRQLDVIIAGHTGHLNEEVFQQLNKKYVSSSLFDVAKTVAYFLLPPSLSDVINFIESVTKEFIKPKLYENATGIQCFQATHPKDKQFKFNFWRVSHQEEFFLLKRFFSLPNSLTFYIWDKDLRKETHQSWFYTIQSFPSSRKGYVVETNGKFDRSLIGTNMEGILGISEIFYAIESCEIIQKQPEIILPPEYESLLSRCSTISGYRETVVVKSEDLLKNYQKSCGFIDKHHFARGLQTLQHLGKVTPYLDSVILNPCWLIDLYTIIITPEKLPNSQQGVIDCTSTSYPWIPTITNTKFKLADVLDFLHRAGLGFPQSLAVNPKEKKLKSCFIVPSSIQTYCFIETL